jgi:hypothetical protein
VQTELQADAAQAAAAEAVQALALAQHREHRFDHGLALGEHLSGPGLGHHLAQGFLELLARAALDRPRLGLGTLGAARAPQAELAYCT